MFERGDFYLWLSDFARPPNQMEEGCLVKWNNSQEGRCEATWKSKFKLPWREARPPYHYEDKLDSDQKVVKKELSLPLEKPS